MGINDLTKIDLMKEATGLKQLEKGTAVAIPVLRKAGVIVDECALDENYLPDQWQYLVQYRSAHLLLRNAVKDIELYEEIGQLLSVATFLI